MSVNLCPQDAAHSDAERDRYEAKLEAYVFDELSPDERQDIDRHLDACEQCRRDIGHAKLAIAGMSGVSDPPLPYEHGDRQRSAWAELTRRLPAAAPRTRSRAMELVALAAVLVIGVNVGVLLAPERNVRTTDSEESLAVEPEAIRSLERAELLADAGLRYAEGVQTVLAAVAELPSQGAGDEEVIALREQARELLRDGQLLSLALDLREDRAFLRTIANAELMLEELAAVDASGSGTGVESLKTSLAGASIRTDLDALDLQHQVSIAYAASGWLGRDGTALPRKEF